MRRFVCSLFVSLFLVTTAIANQASVFDPLTDELDVAKLLSNGLAKINESFGLRSEVRDAVVYTQSRWDLNHGGSNTDFLVAVKMEIPGQEVLLAVYSVSAEGVETIGLLTANPDGRIVYSEPANSGILYFERRISEAEATLYANKLNQIFPDLNAQSTYSGYVTFNITRDFQKVIHSVKKDKVSFEINSNLYLGTTVLSGPFKISELPTIQKYSDIVKAEIPVNMSDFRSITKTCSASFQ